MATRATPCHPTRDWGKGFDSLKVGTDRFGLKGIRERARILGGRASITSQPGHGVETVVELPLNLEDHANRSETATPAQSYSL
jgi:signal transduction histidine kinase